MGNIFPKNMDSSSYEEPIKKNGENNILLEELENLKKEIKDLKKENLTLKESIISDNTFTPKNKENLRKFINEWYDKNSDNIDIGVIDLPFGGSIDILPDSIEKHIYLKTLSLLMEILAESKISFMGQEMRITFEN